MLVGDAAGFIDPMTGDGLRFALMGAELAADIVDRGITLTGGGATPVSAPGAVGRVNLRLGSSGPAVGPPA